MPDAIVELTMKDARLEKAGHVHAMGASLSVALMPWNVCCVCDRQRVLINQAGEMVVAPSPLEIRLQVRA